ncbi:penicillin-binding transpeptidase domain-containing protein [Silvibacterium acidisoli]|uniref:penicillin-binding transpeptidase domain-containing protein n=1 Tax=Acidobacteriaceae bacterium ZG23-2 TaxID=2883246 RepID=UPI00406C2160
MKRFVPFALMAVLLLLPVSLKASASTRRRARSHAAAASVRHTARRAGTKTTAKTVSVRTTRTYRGAHLRRANIVVRRHRIYERFTADSFTDQDLTQGDVTAGEDPVVRQAAISALGNMYGTVLAIDPNNGRILAMVNQKLALSSGAEPCSTIKLSVALAALEEGIITKDTQVNLGGSYSVNLTYALARSINPYFEVLGRRLGFERVRHYANEFGLGELAGYNIPGEQLGVYPSEPLPEAKGGVGRMCSFGESVSMTPLQLGAMVAAIANGGTLYYLQHPTTPNAAVNYTPRIKRQLDIGKIIPEIQPGMAGAVDASYGTARSLKANFNQFPVMGKTGTCSDDGTRFGWFASYADTQYGRIVTVVFLEGGRATFGPKAAELTGMFYRNLWDHSYFASKQPLNDGTQQTTAVGVSQ